MKVGESFVVHTNSQRYSAYWAARVGGIKVSIRKDENDAMRVWRIA